MYYPCAAALVEIGQPSPVIEEMTQKIQTSERKAERELAAWVIMQIQGAGQAAVTLNALSTQASVAGARRERLLAAQQYIKTFKPTYNHPHSKAISDSRPPLPPGF